MPVRKISSRPTDGRDRPCIIVARLGLGVRVIDAAVAVDANPGGSGELFETNIHYSAKEADLLSEYLHGKVFADRSYSACP